MRRIATAVRRRLRWAAVSVCATIHEACGCEPRSAVFIMGHMRSGSTLLLHLLITHPEIIGCGERNTSYRSTLDLDRLVVESRIRQRSFLRSYRYVADQINHTRFTPNARLLDDPRVRVLFLIRKPEATISSILRLAEEFYPHVGWTVERATDYYVERVNALGQFADTMTNPSGALFLTYEELVENPLDTLARLQTFLDIEEGFSLRYDIQRFTGTRGDPSEAIKAGRIVADRVRLQTELPTGILTRARESHASCVEAMRRHHRADEAGATRDDARP